jgi:hypothetical protein
MPEIQGVWSVADNPEKDSKVKELIKWEEAAKYIGNLRPENTLHCQHYK